MIAGERAPDTIILGDEAGVLGPGAGAHAGSG